GVGLLSGISAVPETQKKIRPGRALSERVVSPLPTHVQGFAMKAAPSLDPVPRRYFWSLLALLLLFCLRVLGQILVAFFGVKFLPPMEEWFSGFLPYPELLASQIIIILLFGKICLDFFRGRGYFVVTRPAMGINLLKFGFLYLGVMIVRYMIRMSLYPRERWAGGSISIFFHWVLASFVIVLCRYHWGAASPGFQAAH